MASDVVDDISDTVSTLIACNRWIKLDLSILQADIDLEDWSQTLKFVVWDTDLLGKVSHT